MILVILLVKIAKNGQKTQISAFEVKKIHLPDNFFQNFFLIHNIESNSDGIQL